MNVQLIGVTDYWVIFSFHCYCFDKQAAISVAHISDPKETVYVCQCWDEV